jgi:transposase-like protein
MWICKDCGEVFKHPYITRDLNDNDHYTLSMQCPRCNSENIEEKEDEKDGETQ